MTYPAPQPPGPTTPSTPLDDERKLAFIVYVAYLAAHFFPPLSVIGLILAYVSRDTAPDWLKTHYTFQIRTFWIGLLYWAVSIVLCVVLIGILGIFATIVWGVIRNVLGLIRLFDRQPYPNPYTWLT